MPKKFTKQGFYEKQCKKQGVQPTGNTFINTNGTLTDDGKKQFKRATFRKGKRDIVYNQAKKKKGVARDPNTGKRLKRKKFAMGHKPGFEHEKHQISAAIQQKSRKQFINEYNNTGHYQAEDPLANSSHQHEDSTNKYFGD